jgi:threonine dehydrogenase-like Zn-dependent dehydrogenase
MLDNRLVDVASIIDARYSLSDMPRAMAHAAQPGVLKVLVQPD